MKKYESYFKGHNYSNIENIKKIAIIFHDKTIYFFTNNTVEELSIDSRKEDLKNHDTFIELKKINKNSDCEKEKKLLSKSIIIEYIKDDLTLGPRHKKFLNNVINEEVEDKLYNKDEFKILINNTQKKLKYKIISDNNLDKFIT